MKIDDVKDDVTRFKQESFEEISRLPYFENDNEGTDNLLSSENDGVDNSKNNQ